MDGVQTESICTFDKGELSQHDAFSKQNENKEDKEINSDHEHEGNDDLSGLMENESFGSCNSLNHSENSDIWKGSDSEDENDESIHKNDDIVTESVAVNENSTEETPNNENSQAENNESCSKDITTKKNNEKVGKKTDENFEKEESEKDITKTSEDKQDTDKQLTPDKESTDKLDDKQDTEKPTKEKEETDKQTDDKEDTEKPTEEKEETDKQTDDKDDTEKLTNDKEDTQKQTNNEEDDKEKNGKKEAESRAGIEGNEENKNKDPKVNGDGTECDVDLDDSMEDFDPSLLCPDISMDIDENPVITNSESLPNDGTNSPLFEPMFSTYVDEVTGAEISFNLTPEELEFKKNMYGNGVKKIEESRLHCTACNVHLGSALHGQNNRFVHPMLKVLICKECYHFYTSGEFDKDEDGSELYCRWCGQGGQVLCCSKCEFVFCKKCIRINFGRRKLAQVRDSDEWSCFRCDPSQILHIRVACAEFFEYVRREMSRQVTLNDPQFWSTDRSLCCTASRDLDAADGNFVEHRPKSRKKSSKEQDPDFHPCMDDDQSEVIKSPLTKGIQIVPQFGTTPTNPKPETPKVPILAMPSLTRPAIFRPILPNNVTQGLIRVGSTTFIPKPPGAVPSATSTTFVRSPVFRPPVQKSPATVTRAPTVVRAQSFRAPIIRTAAQQNRSLLTTSTASNSLAVFTQHEWFEKTVVSAAKVNSHLSYTLSQLNKQQAQANSVEELAVVHNRLQEILSNSINSLIQVRKTLRGDFISGIKNTKFAAKTRPTATATVTVPAATAKAMAPPKATVTSTTASKSVQLKLQQSVPPLKPLTMSDDDVIFVPPFGPTLLSDAIASASGLEPPATIILKAPFPRLKVRSFNDLQNVSSDCIIIPDDVPEKNDNKTEGETLPLPETVCNGDDEKKKAPESKSEENAAKEDSTISAENNLETPDDKLKTTANTEETVKTSEKNVEIAEDNLKTSEDNSKTTEDSSKAAEDKLKTTEDNLKTSGDNSKTTVDNSKTPEDISKTTEDNLKTTENNMKTAEDKSKTTEANLRTTVDNLEINENKTPKENMEISDKDNSLKVDNSQKTESSSSKKKKSSEKQERLSDKDLEISEKKEDSSGKEKGSGKKVESVRNKTEDSSSKKPENPEVKENANEKRNSPETSEKDVRKSGKKRRHSETREHSDKNDERAEKSLKSPGKKKVNSETKANAEKNVEGYEKRKRTSETYGESSEGSGELKPKKQRSVEEIETVKEIKIEKEARPNEITENKENKVSETNTTEKQERMSKTRRQRNSAQENSKILDASPAPSPKPKKRKLDSFESIDLRDFNIKVNSSAEFKKMLSAKVYVERFDSAGLKNGH